MAPWHVGRSNGCRRGRRHRRHAFQSGRRRRRAAGRRRDRASHASSVAGIRESQIERREFDEAFHARSRDAGETDGGRLHAHVDHHVHGKGGGGRSARSEIERARAATTADAGGAAAAVQPGVGGRVGGVIRGIVAGRSAGFVVIRRGVVEAGGRTSAGDESPDVTV